MFSVCPLLKFLHNPQPCSCQHKTRQPKTWLPETFDHEKTMTPPAQINTENDSICSLPAFWDVQKEWQRLDGCLGRKKCCWVDVVTSRCQGMMSRVICVNDFIKSLYDINTNFFLPETLCRRFSYEKGLWLSLRAQKEVMSTASLPRTVTIPLFSHGTTPKEISNGIERRK